MKFSSKKHKFLGQWKNKWGTIKLVTCVFCVLLLSLLLFWVFMEHSTLKANMIVGGLEWSVMCWHSPAVFSRQLPFCLLIDLLWGCSAPFTPSSAHKRAAESDHSEWLQRHSGRQSIADAAGRNLTAGVGAVILLHVRRCEKRQLVYTTIQEALVRGRQQLKKTVITGQLKTNAGILKDFVVLWGHIKPPFPPFTLVLS